MSRMAAMMRAENAGARRSDSWSTPRALYDALSEEFGPFTLDPCPIDGPLLHEGLLVDWRGHRVFCNPPYSAIGPWLARAREAETAIYLVPVRSDTEWWRRWALGADEIRFIRGRLKFGDGKGSAPFPSCVLVFGGASKEKAT